jgi:hypothetical protein
MFQEIGKNRRFIVSASKHKFTNIYNKYNEITGTEGTNSSLFDGDKVALFNSADYLELAIFRSNLKTVGGASTLLGLDYRDRVSIDFFSENEPEFTTLK